MFWKIETTRYPRKKKTRKRNLHSKYLDIRECISSMFYVVEQKKSNPLFHVVLFGILICFKVSLISVNKLHNIMSYINLFCGIPTPELLLIYKLKS